MRIIGGTLGSRRLFVPPGTTTRPTLDHVKESLFNILGTCPEGAVVLDLFAGSGALGFEALSRGAEKAVFNDSSKAACTAIRRNAQTLGLMDSTVILSMPWQRALKAMENSSSPFNIIFLDPPYGMDAVPVLDDIMQKKLLAQGGLLLLERDSRQASVVAAPLTLLRSKVYGDTAVDFIGL